MQIYRWTRNFCFKQNCGLIIGNFDGVHRGHQAMIERLKSVCHAQQMPAVAMSFYPHPRALVQGKTPALLSTLRDRAYWLSHYGITDWVLVPFTRRFRQTSAQDFLHSYLQALSPRYLLVGDDFRFGYRGAGDIELLRQFAHSHNIALESLDTVAYAGQRISSSALREAVMSQHFLLTKNLLGHELTFTGHVRKGYGRGQALAARTANIHVPKDWCLPDGVYVVKMRLCNSQKQYWGVANLGAAPTFASTKRKLEVHLLDVQIALYGETVQVIFEHYLRPVQKFADQMALQTQIQQDIFAAKTFIAAQLKEGKLNG